jgi:hypothetical protein
MTTPGIPPEQIAQRDAFLQELSELSRRYGITIGGCGCCGSPMLYFEEASPLQGEYDVDEYNSNLGWNERTE